MGQVPWYNVPDLVGARKVFVQGGKAYVPQSMQISLVLQAFSAKLEKALEVCAPSQLHTAQYRRYLPFACLALTYVFWLCRLRPRGHMLVSRMCADNTADSAQPPPPGRRRAPRTRH